MSAGGLYRAEHSTRGESGTRKEQLRRAAPAWIRLNFTAAVNARASERERERERGLYREKLGCPSENFYGGCIARAGKLFTTAPLIIQLRCGKIRRIREWEGEIYLPKHGEKYRARNAVMFFFYICDRGKYFPCGRKRRYFDCPARKSLCRVSGFELFFLTQSCNFDAILFYREYILARLVVNRRSSLGCGFFPEAGEEDK